METRDEQTNIDRYVDDTVEAWLRGALSLSDLRQFHHEVSKLNHQAACRPDFKGDREALQFMHQVTSGALRRLKSRSNRTTLSVRTVRSAQSAVDQVETKDRHDV